MEVGLLWFDNDPGRGVAAKALDAARRYREKFGVTPNTCYVNSAAINGSEMVVPMPSPDQALLRLRPAAHIRPHHFWVGVEDGAAESLPAENKTGLQPRPQPERAGRPR
ncbi:MAG: hypothetical protein N2439_09630 [Anaerolineae bacterium]|nr:hypothetical protein [Anaerolineae bacterium]